MEQGECDGGRPHTDTPFLDGEGQDEDEDASNTSVHEHSDEAEQPAAAAAPADDGVLKAWEVRAGRGEQSNRVGS